MTDVLTPIFDDLLRRFPHVEIDRRASPPAPAADADPAGPEEL